MRITDSIIHSRVAFNMQRSIRRFLDIQTGMSSGKRVNTPSDDPGGTVRGMTYQSEINKIEQQQKNISQGMNWVTTYDSAMADMSDFLSTAKEIAVAMSNGTYDEVAREGSANEISSIIDQMIQLGNSQLEGRRIFAGFSTRLKPFDMAANGVVYRGDFGKIDFEIESSLKLTINSNGADVFLKRLNSIGEKADLNVGVNGTTLLAELNGGSGVNLGVPTFTITNNNLNTSVTVDLTGATSLADVISAANTQLNSAGFTDISVGLGPEGNNLRFDTTQSGQIAAVTPLANLNNGLGIDLVPGRIRVSNGSGVDVTVDVSTATTVGDVISQFNTQLAAGGINNVTLTINGSNSGFVITDTNATPLGLSISETSSTENTASNLGLLGSINPILNGAPLNPQVSFTISETTGVVARDLGIGGTINSDYSGTDLNAILTLTSPVLLFNNGVGIPRGEIALRLGEQSATVDLGSSAIVSVQDMLDAINNAGLNVTATINTTRTGIQIVNNDPTRSFMIEDVDARAAKSMGMFGSSDMMGTLMLLNKSLKNNDQEAAGMLLENIDSAILHMLNERATVGARTIRLETTDSRQTGQELNFTKLFSETIDADLPELVTTLSTYENNYRSALIASAKIIQPTLLDFLRR